MSVYAGIFTANKNPEQLNKRSFRGTILRRQPNGHTPLLGLTAMTKDTKALATTHGYFSKTLEFSRTVVTAEAVAGAAVLTVNSVAGLVPGQLLHNALTGENIRIVAIPATNQLSVQRAFGRVPAATIAADSVLVVIGTAYEQGSARPIARGIVPVYAATFTQIFRNAWAITDTARASYAELGYSNMAESKRDCFTFHGIDQESSLFFSQPYMNPAGPNGKPIHSTQGIIDAVRQYAPGNVHALLPDDKLGFDDIVDIFLPMFKYDTDLGDGKTRILFVDTVALLFFQRLGRLWPDMVSMTQKETAFGMIFTEFRFIKGTIYLVEHSLFNGLELPTPGLAVAVDLPAVSMAFMEGRKFKEETYGVGGTNQESGVTSAGVDAQGGSLTSEWALELVNPLGCGVITGLANVKPRVQATYAVDAADLPNYQQ